MSKFTSLFMICTLLFFLLFLHTYAARPVPDKLSKDDASPVKTQHVRFETESGDVEESCEGVGEEECLMRRTLVAHTDYIYTQKKQP